MVTREEIIQEARDWIGTRFHHQGRMKRNEVSQGGCDCLGLIIGIARNLKITVKNSNSLLCKYDYLHYGKVIDRSILYDKLYNLMYVTNELKVGDVILFNIQNRLQHLAIYSYNDAIIHCLINTRKVVEHHLNDFWSSKITHMFYFAGLE